MTFLIFSLAAGLDAAFPCHVFHSRYWPKLSDWLKNIGVGGYEKNRPDMYEVLRPYMDIAIANAKRLDKRNEGRKPSESVPGTKVYELVEMLKPYLIEE